VVWRCAGAVQVQCSREVAVQVVWWWWWHEEEEPRQAITAIH